MLALLLIFFFLVVLAGVVITRIRLVKGAVHLVTSGGRAEELHGVCVRLMHVLITRRVKRQRLKHLLVNDMLSRLRFKVHGAKSGAQVCDVAFHLLSF